MHFLILNGPNLNLLGLREPGLYGAVSYQGMMDLVTQACAEWQVQADFYQSNHEGDLVDAIQNALGRYDGIVLNPGAYTHTSIAILDALKAVSLPAAEVHITDIAKREAFRQVSYAGMACQAHFIGQGLQGYINGVRFLMEYCSSHTVKQEKPKA